MNRVWVIAAAAGLCWMDTTLTAEPKLPPPVGTNRVQVIDLASALELAGARNLEVQIARERLVEARANSESSVWRFFPWIAPGFSYRRHTDLIQDVAGNMFDVDKESYSVGPSVTALVDLGDAIYNNLAARQLVKASNEALESRRAQNLLESAQAYFELVRADAAVGIAREAVRITESYLDQVQRAVEAGIAYRGDVLRVQVQAERNRMLLRQTEEQKRVASARLVEILNLEATTDLAPNSKELAPLSLFATNVVLDALVGQAQMMRPELKESAALVRASEATRKGTVYGPLIPTVGGQMFAGGLGGGPDGSNHRFDDSEDYQVGISWRLGPGGLLDRSRMRQSEARLRIVELEGRRLEAEISREVVERFSRVQSLEQQLTFARRAAELAEASLRLYRDRRSFAVGEVLETIVSEQELTNARLELATTIAEYNKAQYGLARAVGTVLR